MRVVPSSLPSPAGELLVQGWTLMDFPPLVRAKPVNTGVPQVSPDTTVLPTLKNVFGLKVLLPGVAPVSIPAQASLMVLPVTTFPALPEVQPLSMWMPDWSLLLTVLLFTVLLSLHTSMPSKRWVP